MISTFAMEFFLAGALFMRYRMDTIGKLGVATLLGLGTFQISEYAICTMGPFKEAAVLGYVAITLLPPFGLHLATKLAGVRHGPVRFSYGLAAVWCAMFILHPAVIVNVACNGNYSILNLTPTLSVLYGVYYFGLLFIGLGLSWWAKGHRSGQTAEAAKWLAVSYLIISLPTFTVNVVVPSSRSGIPSIMCGFALLFALILATRIIPAVGTLQTAGERARRFSFR